MGGGAAKRRPAQQAKVPGYLQVAGRLDLRCLLAVRLAGVQALAVLPRRRRGCSRLVAAAGLAGRSAAEPDYLPALQKELVAVISKYIQINPDDIKVQLERQDDLEVLEVKIELPDRK